MTINGTEMIFIFINKLTKTYERDKERTIDLKNIELLARQIVKTTTLYKVIIE